ncbi:hypothetical protein KY349_05795 [Candidatus Woesearchaeota archaeon]|nr:hypothetical protein [Candidatus Woesearchaeota archaeon]
MKKVTREYLQNYLVIIILAVITFALLVTACIRGFWNQAWFLKAIALLIFLILVDAVRNYVTQGVKDPKKVCCIMVRILIAVLVILIIVYLFSDGF